MVACARELLSNDPARGKGAVIAGIRGLLDVPPGAVLPLKRRAEVRGENRVIRADEKTQPVDY